MLNTTCALANQILKNNSILTLQMRRLGLMEVKSLARFHIASKWQRQGLNPGMWNFLIRLDFEVLHTVLFVHLTKRCF